MGDSRKSVMLPPEIWRDLRKISYEQEVKMVRLIERWAKKELAQMEKEKVGAV